LKIYLMRHGSFENPDRIFPGHAAGYHLTDLGKKQVLKTAKLLEHAGIRKIYCSPIERTIETAKILAEKLGLNKNAIIVDPALIEINLPKLAGKPMTEFNVSAYAKDNLSRENGESMEDAGKRILEVLKKIVKEDKNALVVSHSDPIIGAVALIKSDRSANKRGLIDKGCFFIIDTAQKPWEVKYVRV